MKDLHSHFLYGVDDGSKSLEETKEMLKNAYECGVTDIVFTPHYIDESKYVSEVSENEKIFNTIKEEAEHLNINIYLGNEVYISNNILKLYKEKKLITINNSRYMLIEIPMHSKINEVKSIFFELISNGIVPILAHPERYDAFKEDYSIVDTLREDGFLFQSNYSSILGYYGKDSIKLLKYMLKRHYIDFLGTDIHRIEKTYVIDNFKKIEKHIIKVTGSEYYNKIQLNNNKLV